MRLCTGQIEASIQYPPPPRGLSRAFHCALCLGSGEFWMLPWKGGEFEPDLSVVLVVISPMSFFGFHKV